MADAVFFRVPLGAEGGAVKRTGARGSARVGARVKALVRLGAHGRTGIAGASREHIMHYTTYPTTRAPIALRMCARPTRAHPCARALRGFAGAIPVRLPVRQRALASRAPYPLLHDLKKRKAG